MHEQPDGAAMERLASAVLANLYMEEFQEQAVTAANLRSRSNM